LAPSPAPAASTAPTPPSGEAGPQNLIFGPDHMSVPVIRLVNESEAIVCWADGSVQLVNAIPDGDPLSDGTQLGYLDVDEDGRPDTDIWKP